MIAFASRRGILAGVLLAVAAIGAVLAARPWDGVAAGAVFYEDFSDEWSSRWTYSSGKKYRGRFTTVQPEGFQDAALQARVTHHHVLTPSSLCDPPALPSCSFASIRISLLPALTDARWQRALWHVGALDGTAVAQ